MIKKIFFVICFLFYATVFVLALYGAKCILIQKCTSISNISGAGNDGIVQIWEGGSKEIGISNPQGLLAKPEAVPERREE